MRRSCAYTWVTVVLLGVHAGFVPAGAHPLDPLPKALWSHDDAAHLLRRAAFGGSPDQIDEFFKLGLAGAVERLLDISAHGYRVAPPAMDDLVKETDAFALRNLPEEQRRQKLQKRRRAERQAHLETRMYWLERLVESPQPLQERMTLFWHGHLTSGAREVRRALFMYEQNELLRRHALGNFRDLLIAISQDRAMLVYLDNARNNKRTPNENYARELLELFTLGEGNYGEGDIKAAARAFTGWGYDRTGFVFRSRMHDHGQKTFLGQTGNWDGADIIDIILAQPQCAQFLATELLVHFCSPEPRREEINRLAALIRRQEYEMKPVMAALLKSKAFYHERCRGAIIKSPVELIVGTARQLELPVADLFVAERALAALGQELMQPPSVKGWDGGPKWINTATLYQRYNYVARLIEGTGEVLPVSDTQTCEEEVTPRGMMMGPRRMDPESRRGGDPQPAYNPLPTVQARELATAEVIVDFYVENLLATPLPEEKRAVLIEFLADDGRFDVSQEKAGTHIRAMLQLLVSTPEYQLY